MKTLLYVSLSLNGQVLLAKESNHQIPQEILADFMQYVIKAGNLIIGRKTAELFLQNPASIKTFESVDLVVVSKQMKAGEGYSVVSSPTEALERLNSKGFTTALLAGGPALYRAFLNDELVDELIVNINPRLTGEGGLLMDRSNAHVFLTLTDIHHLTSQTIQLRYTKGR